MLLNVTALGVSRDIDNSLLGRKEK